MGWTTKELNSYQGGDFSLQNALTGSGAHPIFYSLATSCSFPGCKVARDEVDHSPPSTAEVNTSPPHGVLIFHDLSRQLSGRSISTS